MSHFVVGVITVTGEEQEVDKLLAPYHEFECTGLDDEFVLDIDITEAKKSEYLKDTETRLKFPDGTLESFFDSKGEWRPDYSQVVENSSEMFPRRTYLIPEGCERVEVPSTEVYTFVDWLRSEDFSIVYHGQPLEMDGKHKYGYAQLEQSGEVHKIVDRTNPNRHWDWWVIGGRWSGYVPGNVSLAKDLPAPEEGRTNKFFALVTPDGEWIEKGRMGWWACVSDEKDNWAEIEARVLAKYPEHKVVVVDCHI